MLTTLVDKGEKKTSSKSKTLESKKEKIGRSSTYNQETLKNCLMGKKGFKEMQVTTTLKKLKFNLTNF
jgi:hypothetical protein